ncbi:MAG: uncharacterized protein PWP03_164 [Candidatus Woesearchaeota archaeon]|nr:uncharacterized protein [Candidatus Woesearchaeota archaeon]MDN5327526.1 uncharacterized protein [Candidatus Woesearchaeota archaeon]
MPRPCKRRFVSDIPEVSFFKPAGVRLRDLEEVILTVEEFEAVKLKDFMGLDQVACAEKMNVSQPTFHRILSSARKKLADAIVNGKAIRIEGGNFALRRGRF